MVGDQPHSPVLEVSVSLGGLAGVRSNDLAMTPMSRGLDDEWISVMTAWHPIRIEQLLVIYLFAWKAALFVHFTPM